MSFRTQATLVALLGAFVAPTAFAQAYRCTVGGTLYITDKPCAAPTEGRSKLGAVEPARTPTAYREPLPTLQPAPEHQRYLSGRCAGLNDAIRTAHVRGVGAGTVNDLRREYARDCAEDDQNARQQVSDLRAKTRQDARDQRQEAERSREDAQRLQERCVALRDALRHRSTATEADRAAKRVAEEAYNANCLGR